MALTKQEIINSICGEIGVSKTECIQITENIFEIIKEELQKGDSVMVSGFGKWTVRPKRKRMGRNPQTGERMVIDARKVITFKASNLLKNALNSEK